MSYSGQDRIDCPFCEKKISVYEECSQELGIASPPPKPSHQSAYEATPCPFRSNLITFRYLRALGRVGRYAWQLMLEALPKDSIRFLHERKSVRRICTCRSDCQNQCQSYEHSRRSESHPALPLCMLKQLTKSEAVRDLLPIAESTFRLLPEEDRCDVIVSLLRELGYEVEGNLRRAAIPGNEKKS